MADAAAALLQQDGAGPAGKGKGRAKKAAAPKPAPAAARVVEVVDLLDSDSDAAPATKPAASPKRSDGGSRCDDRLRPSPVPGQGSAADDVEEEEI